MNLNIFKKRKSGLTLVVATTLLFAAPMAAQAATPDKPGNSTPEHKGAVTGLAQTGASDTGLMIAGATALVTAGGIALLLRRRQNNN